MGGGHDRKILWLSKTGGFVSIGLLNLIQRFVDNHHFGMDEAASRQTSQHLAIADWFLARITRDAKIASKIRDAELA